MLVLLYAKSSHDAGVSEDAVYIAAATVLIFGSIVVLTLLIISVCYKQLRPAKLDLEARQQFESKIL